MKTFHRGVVLFPKVPSSPSRYSYSSYFFGIRAHKTDLVGYHVYVGKNRWLLPSGRINKGQSFHRKMLSEFHMGWWIIVP